jgi:Protein of unknown function (DUF3631)
LRKIEAAARIMSSKAAQDSKSFSHYLLESLGRIFAERRAELAAGQFQFEADGKFFFKSGDVLDKLNADDEAPWREGKDQVLTTARMAKELKEYGIKSEQVKRAGERGKGYWSNVIEAAVEKYRTEIAADERTDDEEDGGDKDEAEGYEGDARPPQDAGEDDDTDTDLPF